MRLPSIQQPRSRIGTRGGFILTLSTWLCNANASEPKAGTRLDLIVTHFMQEMHKSIYPAPTGFFVRIKRNGHSPCASSALKPVMYSEDGALLVRSHSTYPWAAPTSSLFLSCLQLTPSNLPNSYAFQSYQHRIISIASPISR